MVLAALAAAVAIFVTTPRGAAIVKRLGLRLPTRESVPAEDRDYLLRVSGGDPEVVATLLDRAWAHNPEMSEKEAYRRAIRAHLNSKK